MACSVFAFLSVCVCVSDPVQVLKDTQTSRQAGGQTEVQQFAPVTVWAPLNRSQIKCLLSCWVPGLHHLPLPLPTKVSHRIWVSGIYIHIPTMYIDWGVFWSLFSCLSKRFPAVSCSLRWFVCLDLGFRAWTLITITLINHPFLIFFWCLLATLCGWRIFRRKIQIKHIQLKPFWPRKTFQLPHKVCLNCSFYLMVLFYIN